MTEHNPESTDPVSKFFKHIVNDLEDVVNEITGFFGGKKKTQGEKLFICASCGAGNPKENPFCNGCGKEF